jgi:TPR repeat protein
MRRSIATLGVLFAVGCKPAETETVATPDDAPAGSHPQPYQDFREACEADDAIACAKLATAYAKGEGVALDVETAIPLYERACTLGELRSCGHVGFYLVFDGHRPREPKRGIQVLTDGCEAGDGWSCQLLGGAYRDARAVTRDSARAIEWFTRGCTLGLAASCTNVGTMYAHTDQADPDFVAAIPSFERGCVGEDPVACEMLGRVYLYGWDGVEIDVEEAHRLFEVGCLIGPGPRARAWA